MKIYNTKFLKGNQRLTRAIVSGILSAVACSVAFAIVETLLPWSFSLFYVAMAYGVSYCIRTYGRGVEQKFSIVSVVCVICSILLGKLLLYMYPFGFDLSALPLYLSLVFRSFFVMSPNGIIELLCVAYAIYVGYYNARIV